MRLRRTGERLHFVTPTVTHPPAVMLWGSFTVSGVGRIRFLEKNETCNTTWYLKALNQQVRWSASSLFSNSFYLQDDGAPVTDQRPSSPLCSNKAGRRSTGLHNHLISIPLKTSGLSWIRKC